MNFLKRLNDVSNNLERTFLAGAIIFASLLLFVNVVMRYVFNMSIYWAEELVRYLLVWMIFIGASQVTLSGGHVAVDILLRCLPKRAKYFHVLVVSIACIVFFILLGYYSLEQALRVKSAHQVSPAMEFPMWIAYASMPVGALLMLIRYIQKTILHLRGDSEETAELSLD
jgi:C4-dicarboxylate transporter, DctQ subunit